MAVQDRIRPTPLLGLFLKLNMHHRDQRQFFDHKASSWDDSLKSHDFMAIETILELAEIKNDDVLDVGAGTGILVKALFSRKIKSYTAMDFSPGMAQVFGQKFPHLKYVVGDFHELHFAPESFDKILIFNSFPHFERPATIIQNAYTLLRPGGRLIIAHSLSRAKLNACHQHAGKAVENDLLPTNDQFQTFYLDAGFSPTILDRDDLFYVSGIKPSL